MRADVVKRPVCWRMPHIELSAFADEPASATARRYASGKTADI
jgi:hypothetical protein